MQTIRDFTFLPINLLSLGPAKVKPKVYLSKFRFTNNSTALKTLDTIYIQRK